MLTICMSTPKHFDHTLTLFWMKKSYNFWKMLNFKKSFWTLLLGLNWSKNNNLFWPKLSQKSVYVYAEHTHSHVFYPKTFSIWGLIKMCWLKNIFFEPPKNISLHGEKNSFSKISCLGTFKYTLQPQYISLPTTLKPIRVFIFFSSPSIY